MNEVLNIVLPIFSLISMCALAWFLNKTSAYNEEKKEIESLQDKQYNSLVKSIQDKQVKKLNKIK